MLVLVIGLEVGGGCVSSSMRHAPPHMPSALEGNQLPTDLPKEMRDRFEIKETHAVDPAVGSPTSDVIAANGSTDGKRQGKGKKSKNRKDRKVAKDAVVGDRALARSSFAYPVRRPAHDPMPVGERLVYSISYIGVSAGDFTLEVLPYKVMNGRKVYHIQGHAVSSAIFSLFYRLNDMVESFIDYEGEFSHRFHIMLDESKQSRDALELNDSEKKQTFYWNRWQHKTNGYKETKEFGEIQPFSQDSLSALYYVRTIPLPIGSVVTFPVVSEGKTWEAVCTVVRREEMSTPLGRVQTIVIRPEMKYQGILRKSGDSFLWLTDDERRLPVRLEAKVRIGTVVAKLVSVEMGNPAPDPSPGPSGSPGPTSSPSSLPNQDPS